jgi:hypothetical protein
MSSIKSPFSIKKKTIYVILMNSWKNKSGTNIHFLPKQLQNGTVAFAALWHPYFMRGFHMQLYPWATYGFSLWVLLHGSGIIAWVSFLCSAYSLFSLLSGSPCFKYNQIHPFCHWWHLSCPQFFAIMEVVPLYLLCALGKSYWNIECAHTTCHHAWKHCYSLYWGITISIVKVWGNILLSFL